jgi:hypothetical protein
MEEDPALFLGFSQASASVFGLAEAVAADSLDLKRAVRFFLSVQKRYLKLLKMRIRIPHGLSLPV